MGQGLFSGKNGTLTFGMEHLANFGKHLNPFTSLLTFDPRKMAHFFLLKASTPNVLEDSLEASDMHGSMYVSQDVPITPLQDTDL